MYDLFVLLDRSYRAIATNLERWFSYAPQGASWNVVSDYCIGDSKKASDTFAFSLILNHDTVANISAYIAAVAPRDLKSSRTVSPGLISYLNCPVAFSVSYVVDRRSKLLRDYVTEDNMASFLPDARELIAQWVANSPSTAPYFEALDRRIVLFQRDLQRKNLNSKLARQVHLSAAFAAMLFKHLDVVKAPSNVRWISDRDAMFDRYDGIAFDLGYLYFLLLRSMDDGGPAPDRPKFLFCLPGMDGVNNYDELIRLPDHLAGTLADIELPTMRFTHDKFPPVFADVFVHSPNNAIVELLCDKERLTVRRITFAAGSESTSVALTEEPTAASF